MIQNGIWNVLIFLEILVTPRVCACKFAVYIYIVISLILLFSFCLNKLIFTDFYFYYYFYNVLKCVKAIFQVKIEGSVVVLVCLKSSISSSGRARYLMQWRRISIFFLQFCMNLLLLVSL